MIGDEVHPRQAPCDSSDWNARRRAPGFSTGRDAMSDKNKKSGDGTPSADEIIEALALEMGVDNDKDGESPEDGGEAEAKPESKGGGDPMAELGGIFDVGGGGGGKKKGKKKAEAKKSEAKSGSGAKAGGSVDAIESIFNVSGSDPDPVDGGGGGGGYDPLDDDPELRRLERSAGGGTVKLLIGVIVLLVAGLVGTAVFGLGLGDDIVSVLNGTYRDKKDAEVRRLEEEHRQKQLDALEKYGTLRIGGEPRYSLIKLQLENDPAPRIIYAQYAKDSPFTELRTNINTLIQNLKIKKPINIRIEAPGYNPQTVTLTESMWTGDVISGYQYDLNLFLVPSNPFATEELADRMQPFDDEEDEVGGTIYVESTPPGAKIKLNNKLVVDKDGNPIVTKAGEPVALTTMPVDPEDKKKEAKKLKINTPPDNGYKVELFFDDATKPRFVTTVQRSLWTCKVKDDKALGRLPKDARAAHKCDYTYKVVGDFNSIDAEIRRQKIVEEELKKQKEEFERLQREAEEARNGGKK